MWASLLQADQNLHTYVYARWPRQVSFIGKTLQLLYIFFTSPSFAVVLTLLLVGLVISEEVNVIVSISIVSAWLVATLSLAKADWLNKLRIGRRLLIFLCIAALMAFVSDRYARWCLIHYTLAHSNSTEPKSIERAQELPTNDQIANDLKEILKNELQFTPASRIQAPTRQPQQIIEQVTPNEPQASVVFGFYKANMLGTPQTLKIDPLTDNKFTVSISAIAVGETTPENVQIWIRVCRSCEWAGPNPPGFVQTDSDHSFDRATRLSEMLPNVGMGKWDFTILLHKFPRVDTVPIACYYACKKCPPVDWSKPQVLWVTKNPNAGAKLLFPSVSYSPETVQK